MQIIGTDKDGYPIAIERGLMASTIYRGVPKGHGLGDLGINASHIANLAASGGGGFNWDVLFTGINPIIEGIGARIAKGNPPVGGYNPDQIRAAIPPSSSIFSPTLILLGVGGLALVLMMKR